MYGNQVNFFNLTLIRMQNKMSTYGDQFQKMESILGTFLTLELMHEERVLQIESIMAALYPEECREWNIEQGNLEDDEIDEGDLPNPTAYELYQLVENKEEFVEAYKQAFQASIFNSNFLSNKDFDATLEKIIENKE